MSCVAPLREELHLVSPGLGPTGLFALCGCCFTSFHWNKSSLRCESMSPFSKLPNLGASLETQYISWELDIISKHYFYVLWALGNWLKNFWKTTNFVKFVLLNLNNYLNKHASRKRLIKMHFEVLLQMWKHIYIKILWCLTTTLFTWVKFNIKL